MKQKITNKKDEDEFPYVWLVVLFATVIIAFGTAYAMTLTNYDNFKYCGNEDLRATSVYDEINAPNVVIGHQCCMSIPAYKVFNHTTGEYTKVPKEKVCYYVPLSEDGE